MDSFECILPNIRNLDIRFESYIQHSFPFTDSTGTNASIYAGLLGTYVGTLSSTTSVPTSGILPAGSKVRHSVPLFPFENPPVEIKPPRIAIWSFLEKDKLITLMALKHNKDIRSFIRKLNYYNQEDLPKYIYTELMYNLVKFCKNNHYELDKTGAVLSAFHLTHLFFTSKFSNSPVKVYLYFKEMMFCHCLPFVPQNIKLFSAVEARDIMVFFTKLYLRFLPLIRFLTLPNFGLLLWYYSPEERNKEILSLDSMDSFTKSEKRRKSVKKI